MVGASIYSYSHCGQQPAVILNSCSILKTYLVGKTVKVAVFIQENVPFTAVTGQKKVCFRPNCQHNLKLDMDPHGPNPVVYHYIVCH